MQMIFSFDTEDYVDPVSNDALLRLAELHSKYGVPACFGLVGEKARFLRECGRRDVIEAVARHEVGYHSDHHFMLPDCDYDPPFVPEYIETRPWDQAMTRLLADESRGVHDVAEIFGKRPVTWLRNYGDYAPQYLAALAQVGVPVFAYGPPCHSQDVNLIWYCNQLVVANPRHMYENNLHRDDLTAQEKLDQHKQNILQHLEKGTPRLGFVTHPTRFVSDIWWEQPNWMDTVDSPPRGQWRIPPRFSREKREELLWIADEFLRFVSGLDDVECVTFADFWAEHGHQAGWLDRDGVVALAQAQPECLRFKLHGDAVFSPAEQFGLFAFALTEPDVTPVAVRHLLGPVEEPAVSASGGSAPSRSLLDACHTVEMSIREKNRVPARVDIGSEGVGPGTFLRAMACLLSEPDSEHVPIEPCPNLPQTLHEDDYERLASGTPAAYMQKRGVFRFPTTCRLSQLQYWTVKPGEL